MTFARMRKALVALLMATVLLISACESEPPSRFDQVQKESTQGNAPAVVREALPGSSFNRFFPKSGDGYEVIAAQEKKGFAEYKLKQEGKDMAMLSISDTVNVPEARAKFQGSSQKIGGFPAVNQGSTATAVLVGQRFQVKIQSRDSGFTATDRQTWLQKFDLQGLSRLK